MNHHKSQAIIVLTLIISSTYTIPALLLAKLGRVLVSFEQRVLQFNGTLFNRIPILKRAMDADMARELERRKESVRRKRANAQETK